MSSPTPARWEPLPIDPLLPQILATLPAGGTLLLQAPPGAGKTTRVPLALLRHLQTQPARIHPSAAGTILMLEPRRLAAKAAAQRLSALLGEAVGGQVGYRVRLEQRCSAATRLELLTDGLFLRRLQDDPGLSGVTCVIIDEFHERRAEADLALALLREARPLLAPDLRLLIMSATLNLEPLARQLPEAAVLTSEGRSHPVELHHQPPREREPLAAQVVRALERHWIDLRNQRETVLVFLPGQREIQASLRAIQAASWGGALELCPLHGGLPLEAQGRAIATARSAAGKVVLATAIAESSLTIEGVRLVIDSGLSRRSRFDPRTGMDGLITVPASQASTIQRQGRAGRLGPGRCVRLWSAAEQQRRPAFDPAELQEADPLPLVLQLARWGAGLGEGLPWLEPPPPGALSEGQELLRQLGGVDRQGALTPHGRAMARLGLHPRLAHMLLRAREAGWLSLGCELAALLNERDPLSLQEAGSDLIQRLDWLRRPGRHPQRQQLLQLCRQLERQLEHARDEGSASAPAAAGGSEREAAARLVAWAYPERIALARPEGGGRFLTRAGRGARLHAQDPLAGSEALAIATADGVGAEARILQALPLSRWTLEEMQTSEGSELQEVRWDRQALRVRCVRERRLGALVLERRPWEDAPADAVLEALLEGLREQGLEALPWTADNRQLQRRLSLASTHLGEPWPDRSDGALLADLRTWLGDQLHGRRSLDDLRELDLRKALWTGQPWERHQELERLLPSELAIPSGRRARLDYAGGEPVLAVKLQELFGSRQGPTVLEGRLPVTLHLLSPAGRPVQITQDLGGFWQGSYAQVRAELRGRYPRHPWPEDPAAAEATALTRRSLERQRGAGPG